MYKSGLSDGIFNLVLEFVRTEIEDRLDVV